MRFKTERAKRWFERLNGSKHMLWLLALLSFLETIILPVPIEVILIPLMAFNRERLWLIATVTTAGCVVAAIVGYGVGMVLYQSIGTWFIDTMGMQNAYEGFQSFFDQYGFIAILALGILPIPFQVAMITAGLSGYPIYLFVLAALIARGLRYYGLAWLVYQFGARAEVLWKRHALLASLGAASLLAGFVLLTQTLANQIM
ncbi:YqaA family protein [Marinimicrobium agarilyticum]|uniref:YqaA family protein n=1 Tax=Marinimicrobium agarilyticum TaxID=306546 RepID=UPI00040FBF67|nr:VTT domain-containing protein [Marinimicrobium agarilyticum]